MEVIDDKLLSQVADEARKSPRPEGETFLLFACPSWAVFFIGCMPSGINFLHRHEEGEQERG